jgi:hypothetical protein
LKGHLIAAIRQAPNDFRRDRVERAGVISEVYPLGIDFEDLARKAIIGRG